MNLLFDLDGTLTDPRRGILACFKHALETLNVDVPADGELENFIGPSLHEGFSTLLSPTHKGMIKEAVGLYREHFAATGIFENSVYPGIIDALASLREDGAWLSVATVKPRLFANRIIEHFDLSRFFDAVYGSELDGTNSDKSELLADLIKAESLSPNETIMIGDRSHDVLAAKANRVFPIGVLWGYGSREELESAGADLLCEQPKNLLRTLSLVGPRALRPRTSSSFA